MKYDYSPFVGLSYEPPFGCFTFVQKVYRDLYHIELEQVNPQGTSLQEECKRIISLQGKRVCDPKEGDIVLLKSCPWHVGLVIDPPEMLHCWECGTSCVESWKSIHWVNRIEGFYRYAPCL